MEWVVIGDVANVLQLSLTLKLIYAIVGAAKNARMHKRNCRHFAQHLKLIAKLLEQLKPQDVEEYPEYRETREPMEHLEQCLKKALNLVENCRDKSYLYLIAMGWNIVAQFKDYQNEIDRYLRLIPLISLVENHREKLRAIERDRREYTLDEEEKKIYTTLLKDDRTRDDAAVLQKSLSRSYPGLGLERALKEENEKLRKELQRTQTQMDLDQCDVIEHLIEITKTVNVMPEEEQEKLNKPIHSRTSTMESIDSGVSLAMTPAARVTSNPVPPSTVPSNVPEAAKVLPSAPHLPNVTVGNINRDNGDFRTWHNGLNDCCIDPFLCISTFLYPCGTFTNIAAVVTDGEIYILGFKINNLAHTVFTFTAQELACHDLAFHSLYLGCCIYTCCFRRKLRKRFNISGGTCDDCWAHILCCCCALVQEWREIQAREEEGLKLYKMRVPSQQTMENYRPRPNLYNQERYIG